MNTTDEAEAFAARVVDSMGVTEALLMAMRLVLLVGQRTLPDDPAVIATAGEAVAAIKRFGEASRILIPPMGGLS